VPPAPAAPPDAPALNAQQPLDLTPLENNKPGAPKPAPVAQKPTPKPAAPKPAAKKPAAPKADPRCALTGDC
jgi:hypothetical protein